MAAPEQDELDAVAQGEGTHEVPRTGPGMKEGLEEVKRLPAASGYEGTTMGFGCFDHAALKPNSLVLRTWKDGKSVEL